MGTRKVLAPSRSISGSCSWHRRQSRFQAPRDLNGRLQFRHIRTRTFEPASPVRPRLCRPGPPRVRRLPRIDGRRRFFVCGRCWPIRITSKEVPVRGYRRSAERFSRKRGLALFLV